MTKLPLPSVMATWVMFVPAFVIFTEAPTTLASCGSAIRPTMRPCSTCAGTEIAGNKLIAATAHNVNACMRCLAFMCLLEPTYSQWGVEGSQKVVPFQVDCQHDSRIYFSQSGEDESIDVSLRCK